MRHCSALDDLTNEEGRGLVRAKDTIGRGIMVSVPTNLLKGSRWLRRAAVVHFLRKRSAAQRAAQGASSMSLP